MHGYTRLWFHLTKSDAETRPAGRRSNKNIENSRGSQHVCMSDSVQLQADYIHPVLLCYNAINTAFGRNSHGAPTAPGGQLYDLKPSRRQTHQSPQTFSNTLSSAGHTPHSLLPAPAASMHFTLATAAAAALALAPGALAHYRWTHLVVNGATVGSDYQYVRQNTNYNSPVTDVTLNDIRCNTGSQASAANTQTYSVAAGSTIGLGLDQAIYHQSVSALYLSKVTKANTADGSTPWVKVAEVDPTFSSGAINFPSEGLTQLTFTLPKTLGMSHSITHQLLQSLD